MAGDLLERGPGRGGLCLIIASVPHTGSHFLIDMVGYTVLPKDSMMKHAIERNQKFYRFHHVYGGESMEWLLKFGQMAPVISPLRHPMSVAQSWKNRGKAITKEDRRAPMVDLFHNLIELAQRVRITFLPLDVPNRNLHLRRVSEVARRQLRTRWAFFGPGSVKPEIALTSSDRDAVTELMTHPFFEPYYGSP